VDLTLVVAGIVGGAGIVQGIVQGVLTGRGATISARQETARAGIAHADDLIEKFTNLVVAEEAYELAVAMQEFNADLKREAQLKREVRLAYLKAYGAIVALPEDSPARIPAHRAALSLIASLAGPPGEQSLSKRDVVVTQWRRLVETARAGTRCWRSHRAPGGDGGRSSGAST
jgi:hypothetical protein